MGGVDHQRRKGFAPPHVAAGGECAERIAVIRLLARNHAVTRWLADFDEVLARELDRGLDRFRSTRYQVNPVERARRFVDQQLGERLRG